MLQRQLRAIFLSVVLSVANKSHVRCIIVYIKNLVS